MNTMWTLLSAGYQTQEDSLVFCFGLGGSNKKSNKLKFKQGTVLFYDAYIRNHCKLMKAQIKHKDTSIPLYCSAEP
eukprot:12868889-Ditylum_brightwellii.AAC.1